MSRAAVLMLTAWLTGCILLVSPSEGGPHCKIQGDGTDCGKCAVTLCQDAIDTCCGDAACESTLRATEACALGDPTGCRTVSDAATGAPSPAATLAGCIASRCKTTCREPRPDSRTTCLDTPLSKGTACACQLGGTPNGFECGTATVPDVLCCAPSFWPAVGVQCACLPIGCVAIPDGCICERVDYAVNAEERRCEGTHCCAADGLCRCGSRACGTGEREVRSCSLGELGCPRGQAKLDRCSVP